MSHQATERDDLRWITFRVFDDLDDGDQYEPSEPITIVFNVAPLGDLVRWTAPWARRTWPG